MQSGAQCVASPPRARIGQVTRSDLKGHCTALCMYGAETCLVPFCPPPIHPSIFVQVYL